MLVRPKTIKVKVMMNKLPTFQSIYHLKNWMMLNIIIISCAMIKTATMKVYEKMTITIIRRYKK